MILSEKITSIGFDSQFPEHIAVNNPTFVAFLKAYYEYMEQSGYPQEIIQNALTYEDVDTTIDSFIELFLKEYADLIPRDVLYDKKELVKKINSLYLTKGSQNSYDLLFRMLFNAEVESYYPKKKVLRPSDGKWIRKSSVFMDIQIGSASDIENRSVLVRNADSTVRYVLKVGARRQTENLSGSISDVEFYITDNTNVPVSVGDVIEFEGFRAVILPIPATCKIIHPGKNFKLGDILYINVDAGHRVRAKVTKVNEEGGILAVQIFSYGTGYGPYSFYIYLNANTPAPVRVLYDLIGDDFTLTDNLDGISDDGRIYTQNYAGPYYFLQDYVGVGGPLFKYSGSASQKQGNPATLWFKPEGKVHYPGYYKTNDSFISDDIYIQDAHYYQSFSYVLRSEQQLRDYKKAVINNIHPAGTKLFAEHILLNDICSDTHMMVITETKTLNLFDFGNDGIDDSVRYNMNSVQIEDMPIIDDGIVKDDDKEFGDVIIPIDSVPGITIEFLMKVGDEVLVRDIVYNTVDISFDIPVIVLDTQSKIIVPNIETAASATDQAKLLWL